LGFKQIRRNLILPQNTLKQKIIMNQHKHPYHLVYPSPWPFLASFVALVTTFGGVMYMHGYIGGDSLAATGFLMILYTMFVWWRDIIREATYQGHHTTTVQAGLKSGMILFIVSEIMFFLAFFWAFFHSSLAPTIEIGAVWPPKGIDVLNPWEIPFLNTLILLSSGATVTWAHHAILAGQKTQGMISLCLTILLAAIFTGFQVVEYIEAPFTITDGIYGSTFFMATGFHGFHVFIGTIFLLICLLRLLANQFSTHQHFGFEAAAWYWHFVDVVWLFLFVAIYWWGGL